MQEDEVHTDKEPDKSSQALHASRKRHDTIHMKILVPSGAVGAIIGKGGESIAQVQWETGAKIKLSKPNDFYPGTVERVCLIQGTLDGVTRMHNYIMDRMLEKPECMGAAATPGTGPGPIIRPAGPASSGDATQQTGAAAVTSPTTTATPGAVTGATGTSSVWPQPSSVPGSRLPWGRHQQVKILVPNCTAGLVIGKVGTYVKEIKDRTGAFIQISQKSKEINLLERCITIAGEPDQCRAAVALVLAKIAEDPQSTSCPTISYSRVQGPVASAYPTGSPFAFASLPRFPTGPPGTAGPTSSHLVRDSVLSGAGYLPLVDPYTSPVLHAALLQATALAASFNQRPAGPGYYPGACMTTSPPPPPPAPPPSQGGPPAPQQAPPTAPPAPSGQAPVPAGPTVGPSQSGTGQTAQGFGSHEQSPQGPELGLYAAVPNAVTAAAAAQLLSSGGLWTTTGGEAAWSPGDTQIQGLAAAQTGYEPSYPPQMNFAYYPANQSAILSSLASRHPGDPAGFAGGPAPTAGPEFYPTSPPYAAAPVQFAPPGSTLRVTSPGNTPQLASVYPAALAPTTTPQSSLLQMGSERLPAGSQAAAQAIQLGDLFGSLRLGSGAATAAAAAAAAGGTPYADFSASEFGQAFAATLSQHGLLNVPGLGAYSILTSSAPASSSNTMPMGPTEGSRPPLAMGPGRFVGAPTGLGVTVVGPYRDAHVYGASRLRPPVETETGMHYPSAQQQAQQHTFTVKRRNTNPVPVGSDTGSTSLRQSATTEQLGSSTKVDTRTTEVKRPASCYLPPTGGGGSGGPDPSTNSSVIRSPSTSEDSRAEETDQPLSDPSGSDASNRVPCDTPTSSSLSQQSSSPPSLHGATGSEATVSASGDSGSTVSQAPTSMETNENRRASKQALNGCPVTTNRTPNGVKK